MRPSWTKPSGRKPRIPSSHGSWPEYDVSMCPLNMSELPPPVFVSQRPTTLGRPSSTSCHCTWRPMSSSSSRTRSPIACSAPVGLGTETRSTASATSRSASISTEMWQHLLAEQLDLLVPAIAPELEHHVRAPGLAVLLDRSDAVGGSAGDRLALVEELVGHLRLRREPSALLHRVGDGSDLVLAQPGEIEERIGCFLDVLHLLGEVHACNLARAVAAGVAVSGMDRRNDSAADVDVGVDVLARVADEGGRRDRRRQATVGDLAGERLHLRCGGRDIDGRHVAWRLGFILKARHVGAPGIALVDERLSGEDTAHDLDRVAHRPESALAVQPRVVQEDLRCSKAEQESS